MSLIWVVLVFVVLITWLTGLSMFVLSRLKDLEGRLRAPEVFGFKYWSLVRFNPFGDTGGNQSFVLCLMDEKKNGILLTSLHSRTGSRMYAKLVNAGHGETELSREERQALTKSQS